MQFNIKDIIQENSSETYIKKEFEHLPIDTKHFKNLELKILGLFESLDQSLDGWLIKSENYQALNTILSKFKGKVQTIYIDPPFNTGDDFSYIDRFQDSTWLSILNDRINLGYKYLNEKSNFFLHLDENANHLGKMLLGNILNFTISNEIIWDKGFRGTESKGIFQHSHDTIFMVKVSEDAIWNQPTQPYKDPNLNRYDKIDNEGRKYALIKRIRTDGTVYYGKTYPKEEGKDNFQNPELRVQLFDRGLQTTRKKKALVLSSAQNLPLPAHNHPSPRDFRSRQQKESLFHRAHEPPDSTAPKT